MMRRRPCGSGGRRLRAAAKRRAPRARRGRRVAPYQCERVAFSGFHTRAPVAQAARGKQEQWKTKGWENRKDEAPPARGTHNGRVGGNRRTSDEPRPRRAPSSSSAAGVALPPPPSSRRPEPAVAAARKSAPPPTYEDRYDPAAQIAEPPALATTGREPATTPNAAPAVASLEESPAGVPGAGW
jgi:hypothetical protein